MYSPARRWAGIIPFPFGRKTNKMLMLGKVRVRGERRVTAPAPPAEVLFCFLAQENKYQDASGRIDKLKYKLVSFEHACASGSLENSKCFFIWTARRSGPRRGGQRGPKGAAHHDQSADALITIKQPHGGRHSARWTSVNS